jgi:transposase
MNYLIDFENVGTNFHELLDEVTTSDKICIFYTDHCQKISIDQMASIQLADVEFIKTASGKNALDFQLSSYLGYLIAKNKVENQKFLIVSDDNGYNCLVHFWKQRKINIKIRKGKPNILSQKDAQLVEFEEKFKQEFPNIYQLRFKEVIQILKRKTGVNIHNELVSKYGTNGKSIYKLAKPYLNSI